MPTYEYACRSCGHTFEIVQSMSDDALTTCPKCQGELRKIFAPPAIAFKGSGFYATDHGKKSSSTDRSDKKPDAGDGKGPKKDGASDASKGASEGGSKAGSKEGGSSSGSGDGSSSPSSGSGSSSSTAKKETTPS